MLVLFSLKQPPLDQVPNSLYGVCIQICQKIIKALNKDPRDVHMSCVPYSSAAEVVWRWVAA